MEAKVQKKRLNEKKAVVSVLAIYGAFNFIVFAFEFFGG